MPRTIVIVNTRPAGISLPAVSDSGDPIHAKGQVLLPGENDVAVDYWQSTKENKTVQMYLDEDVEYLIEKGEGKAVKLSDGLDALTKKEALEKIHRCDATQILADWKYKTSNKKLKQACKARIAELESVEA